MNVSIHRRGDLGRARRRSQQRGAEHRLPEDPPMRDGQTRWADGVEVLAALWQAALGGFHHTGAPPSR
jgi:hypothetical protein